MSASARPARGQAATSERCDQRRDHPTASNPTTRPPDSSKARRGGVGASESVAVAGCAANSATPIAVAAEPGGRVRVLLPVPLPGALDYLAPDGTLPPQPGAFVRVGLGSRRLIGVVWDGEGGDDSETVPEARLKPVTEVLPTPPLRPELRRFVDRVAAYTLAAPGMVLKMAIGVEEALLPPAPRRICVITAAGLAALAESGSGKKLTVARRGVLEALRDGAVGSTPDLARRAGCGAGVVRGSIAAG